MTDGLKYGSRVYYVPRFDRRLARYIPVTRVRLTLHPRLAVLGEHIVISPEEKKNGNIAYDRIGSFWVSKQAYDAHREFWAQPLWRRFLHAIDSVIRRAGAIVRIFWWFDSAAQGVRK